MAAPLLYSANNVLALIQETCREIGSLAVPSTAIGNSDQNVACLLSLLREAARELRDEFEWAELTKEYRFSTVSSTVAYQLPSDFDRFRNQTQWNRSASWPQIFLTSQEWQTIQSGTVASFPRERFRIRGVDDEQFFITPTPDSADTVAFEYISKNWLLPPTAWAAGQAVIVGDWRRAGGNVYQSATAATTGATEPTHLNGAASDGTVSWTFTPYENPVADTDYVILDFTLLKLSLKWRFLEANGQNYDHVYQRYKERLARRAAAMRGAGPICLSRRASGFSWNVPDTGYGA